MNRAIGSLGLAALLTTATAFAGDHHERRVVGFEAGRRAVAHESAILMRCPDWRDRDDAAHELRGYDWRVFPEIVAVLSRSMLCDPHEEVREEAAESLAKLAPCLPTARVALARSAATDPDHATRKWARRALDRIADGCPRGCAVCLDPVVTTIVRPAPVVIEVVPQRAPAIIEGPIEPLPPPVEVETLPPVLPDPVPPEAVSPFAPTARGLPLLRRR